MRNEIYQFSCENCLVTAEWDHLAFYRKQSCDAKNALPMQTLKEYNGRKRCIERHNKVALEGRRHVFMWPCDETVREKMIKPRLERKMSVFTCKECSKPTQGSKVISAMRQECGK